MSAFETPPPLFRQAYEDRTARGEGRARHDHPDTAKAAAASVSRFDCAVARRLILAAIKAAPDGLTDEEVSAKTGIPLNTVRPRRNDLVDKGLIRDSGRRVPTAASGKPAIRWTTEGVPP